MPFAEALQRQAHHQRGRARAVGLDVIADAPSDFSEAEAAVEGHGRRVAILNFQVDGGDLKPGEFLEVVGEQYSRETLAAGGRTRRLRWRFDNEARRVVVDVGRISTARAATVRFGFARARGGH